MISAKLFSSFLFLSIYTIGSRKIPTVQAFSTHLIGAKSIEATTIETYMPQITLPESFSLFPGRRSSSGTTAAKAAIETKPTIIPKLGKDGLYHIKTEDQYRSLLEAHPDKLIVLKVYAPWCKTCKALAPKFVALARGLTQAAPIPLPIVWADLAYTEDETHTFCHKVLGIRAVPSVCLLAGNGRLVDTFPCGPTKVSKVLKPKLAKFVADHVDFATGSLKPEQTTAFPTMDVVRNSFRPRETMASL